MRKSSNKYVIKKDSFLNIENPFYCTLEKYRILS